MPTEKENNRNMKRCPRFESCDIPKCPLDFWAKERVELPEDPRCLYWKVLGKRKTKRMFGGRISPLIKKVVLNVRNNWASSDKYSVPKA